MRREEAVRSPGRPRRPVSTGSLCPPRAPGPSGPAPSASLGVVVLDIVYLFAVIAVFAVIAFVAKGVEKL